MELHFTLVFPTDNIEKSVLIGHVARIAAQISSFEVVIRCATLGDPSFMDHAHAFSIPDEGFSGVVRLHDALYTGPLRSELRLDLPFVPHIGVAGIPQIDECKTIADRLNREKFEIRARVEMIDIIGYDGKKTWAIEEFALTGGEA